MWDEYREITAILDVLTFIINIGFYAALIVGIWVGAVSIRRGHTVYEASVHVVAVWVHPIVWTYDQAATFAQDVTGYLEEGSHDDAHQHANH